MEVNQIILIIFTLVLVAGVVVMLLLGQVYPYLKVFFITLSLGIFAVIIYTLYSLYQKSRARNILSRRELENIVPGQCPDYWTRGISNGQLVCENKFRTVDDRGRAVEYKFTGKRIRDEISLTDVSELTNAKKCDMFGNSKSFNAPWTEMQQKCIALNKNYNLYDTSV